jgi:hypothetical protein
MLEESPASSTHTTPSTMLPFTNATAAAAVASRHRAVVHRAIPRYERGAAAGADMRVLQILR